MKITAVKTTPLFVPYTKRYHWAQGTADGAEVVFIEIQTDSGLVGYGESIGGVATLALQSFIDHAASMCIGRDPFSNAGLMAELYHRLFRVQGVCSSPRFAGQVLGGVEMALWDVMGKATGQPAHALLGGAVREDIQYFGFAQGETAEEVAVDALALASRGFEVIYFKAGRGDALDLETVASVRAAIGPTHRLRVDPNENWTPVHASRMIRQLLPFGVEVVEQPTHCESVAALAQVRAASPIAVSADQAVFTPFDAYDVCRQKAADLIVVGLHETGGLVRFGKVAHIAEAAGLNVCIHGLHETGITTCASNQIAATVPNLDDANQHMGRFLKWDLVKTPDLVPENGRLPVLTGPGLGFELDQDAVDRSAEEFRKRQSDGGRGQAGS